MMKGIWLVQYRNKSEGEPPVWRSWFSGEPLSESQARAIAEDLAATYDPRLLEVRLIELQPVVVQRWPEETDDQAPVQIPAQL